MNRTDCHRPGAIVPADYSYACSYDIGGMNEPPWGMDEVRRLMSDATPRDVFGHPGKCGVCGACYRYGDLWIHVPTGDLVHVGHDCADKYRMLANRGDFNAHLEMLKVRRKAAIEAERRKAQRERLFAEHPELAAALETDHYIVRDIRSKLYGRGYDLSEKQVALVFKIAKEEAERAERNAKREEEVKVAAPVSDKRQVVRGILVSKKVFDGAYGTSIRGTIKVTTPEGVWLAWGTLPSSLLLDYSPEGETVRAEVGDEVELTAKLTAGREPHFALFKRPTNGKIITKAAAKEAA